MKLNDLLALSHVPRWSIVRHNRGQSVADHTFRMTVIAIELAYRLGVPTHADFLLKCLYHDGPEAVSGDIPSGIKRKLEGRLGMPVDDMFTTPTDFALSPSQTACYQLADKIEGYTWIKANGTGMHALRIADKCMEEINGILDDLATEQPVFNWKELVIHLICEIEEETGRTVLSPRD